MFKLFKRKKYNTNGVFTVLIIDDKATDLCTTLGITDKRRDELADICREAIKLNKLSESLIKVYSQCKHENEIAYSTLLIGRLHEQANNHADRLVRLFDQLTGRE